MVEAVGAVAAGLEVDPAEGWAQSAGLAVAQQVAGARMYKGWI